MIGFVLHADRVSHRGCIPSESADYTMTLPLITTPVMGYFGRRNWGPPLLRTQSVERFSFFRPGVGQLIALDALPAARNCA